MKIEKVNDNQIRCTFTREDLDHRHLKLSELAYGTEKAKSLFREMMQQAACEFGFEAEDIPVMVEAIPLSAETILLIITKVEYPEELDTRFSKFSDTPDDYKDFDSASDVPAEGADDIIDLYERISQSQSSLGADRSSDGQAVSDTQEASAKPPVRIPLELSKLFIFHDMDTLEHLSHILAGFYDDCNTLYRQPSTSRYCLIIRKGHHSPKEFNKVCNILSEYSHQEKYLPATEAFMEEHYDILIPGQALQVLAEL